MKYNDLLDMPIPKVSVMITLDKVFEDLQLWYFMSIFKCKLRKN